MFEQCNGYYNVNFQDIQLIRREEGTKRKRENRWTFFKFQIVQPTVTIFLNHRRGGGNLNKEGWHYWGCECSKTEHKSGSRVGAVARVLNVYQCVPGLIPKLSFTSGLSLLVLYSGLRGFSLSTSVFPSLQKPTFDLI